MPRGGSWSGPSGFVRERRRGVEHMTKQKIRCAKGVLLTTEQRAKLEGFQAREQVLQDRIEKAELAFNPAIDRLHEAEDRWLEREGLEWQSDELYRDVVGRRFKALVDEEN